ncbi:15-hydroxyprostaglandin dehydrogenase [NAD(+)]-like [Aricia agestis]|uniref:15-hydroxyprostaglandin dehydrogenase [NAD(+)]-like n=1 Tax=Aricia agestis TaxID=91739 RepID=UPI001C20B195|nr:15-hydroxyprostaglandin dehydrogenase [NAD(+)]-like [Aricia agestis]
MSSVPWKVEDKVVLVTGGAAGVGAALVREMVAQNARHVAFLDIAEREGGALEAELTSKFGALRAKFIRCDVASEAALTAAYKQVLDKYHRLDLVVNNAAVVSNDERDYRKMVDINFTATVSSTLKALVLMSGDGGGSGGSGGVVVNMSSLLALKPVPHLPVYSATKSAVLQFSNCIAASKPFSETQVRVLTVCLGPTDTAIIHRHNFTKDNHIETRVPERQRVSSAVAGILDVISSAGSGTTWVIADNKPARDVSRYVTDGFHVVSEATEGVA